MDEWRFDIGKWIEALLSLGARVGPGSEGMRKGGKQMAEASERP